MDGIVLADKPTGITSFDVVKKFKKLLNIHKVGHTGTLDPFASGLLIVCIGEATKLVHYLMDSSKTYYARVLLGQETNTLDPEGEIVNTLPIPQLSKDLLNKIFKSFLGTTLQTPPVFSAIKIKGKPAYKRARIGDFVQLEPRKVTITNLNLINIYEDGFDFKVSCQKGTYIRSLARDMAKSLGTCGHLTSLRRLESSGFNVDSACHPDELKSKNDLLDKRFFIDDIKKALPGMLEVKLNQGEDYAVKNGQLFQKKISDFSLSTIESHNYLKLISPDGNLRAIGTFLLKNKSSLVWKTKRGFYNTT